MYIFMSTSKVSKKRLAEIEAIPDEAIDLSDIPQVDENFWAIAKVVLPSPKKSISIRIDQETYDWFKEQGTGYQSKINAILKSYIQATQKKASA